MPMSHSAYPSCAFVYFGEEATVFYSGDLRLQPLADVGLYPLSLVIPELGVDSVDLAIIEGTNFGTEALTPLLQYHFAETLSAIMEKATLASSSLQGRALVLGPGRLLRMLERPPGKNLGRVCAASELLEASPPLHACDMSLGEIFLRPRGYVLVGASTRS